MPIQDEYEILTRTGPGTPGGDLLRRYWQPVALAEELPPGGPPLPIRLLSEDLVLFRDDEGRPGLLGLHCSHRGADLSYGRLEDGGLRCIYHGWLYDVEGRCLEQPGEPAGSTFHERIRHLAYPCREAGGLILGYLGPGEPPLLPPYDFFKVPEPQRFASKDVRECNYLQGNEGNIDPQHLGVLHWTASSPRTSSASYHRLGPKPTIEVEETDFGVRLFTMAPFAPDLNYVKITNFILPNLSAFEGSGIENFDGYGANWHVPIDDTHHWVYTIFFDRKRSLEQEAMNRLRPKTEPKYQRTRTKVNRYLQDRQSMKSESFAGLGNAFGEQDACVIESRPIQDRTQEHPGPNDRAIMLSRQVLLRALRAVQEGRDPPHLFRAPPTNGASNIVVTREERPASEDWRAYLRSKIQPLVPV